MCPRRRHHHRLIHQAPGWTLRGLGQGALEWTTPTGQVLITRPTRFGADDDLPPPTPGPTHPPDPTGTTHPTDTANATGTTGTVDATGQTEPDDDEPPFWWPGCGDQPQP